MNDPIVIRDNIIRSLLVMAARQLILGLSAVAFTGFALDGGVAEALASGLVFVGFFAWGQIRGYIEKRKALTIARAAPDHIAVVTK